jgi:hypothetical protein
LRLASTKPFFIAADVIQESSAPAPARVRPARPPRAAVTPPSTSPGRPAAVTACCGCIVGNVEEVAPESFRRESRCRQKVSRLWTFSCTVRTNGRTGSAAGLQVVGAMLQRNGSRVRSMMNRSSLATWVRWYLDCTMMYGPKGFSRVWGLSLTRQLTGELGGERAHV